MFEAFSLNLFILTKPHTVSPPFWWLLFRAVMGRNGGTGSHNPLLQGQGVPGPFGKGSLG